MTQQLKVQDLDAVNQRIDALREQIGKTNEDIGNCIEKRDKLNERVHVLRQEIGELKKERDRLNESVRLLKQQRDEVRTTIRPYIEDIKVHSQKIKDLREKRSGIPRNELQKRFDAIEWKIATTSLDLHEEKRLIEEVKQVEIQLNVYKRMDQHSRRISEIKNEMKVFQDKAEGLHQELTANAKKSQELHAKMQAEFEEMNKAREEANNLHLSYLQARMQVRTHHEEMSAIWEQKKKLMEEYRKQQDELRRQTRDNDVSSRKAKEQEVREKIGSQAKVKLERGEQVDWRELQLLSGNDSETEE